MPAPTGMFSSVALEMQDNVRSSLFILGKKSMQGTREVSDQAEGTHVLSSWQLVQSQPHRIQVH